MMTVQSLEALIKKLTCSIGMIGTTVALASTLSVPAAQARSGHAVQDVNKVYSMLERAESEALRPKTFACYNNQNPACKNPVRYSIVDRSAWANYFQASGSQPTGSGGSGGGPSTGSPSAPGNTPGSSGSGGR